VNQQPMAIGCHLPSSEDLATLPEMEVGFSNPGLFDK